MKKNVAFILALILCFGLCSASLAAGAGESRVIIGANLSAEQKAQVYKDFGLTPGTVTELVLTNEEERACLKGLVPEGKIGNVALSCIYIEVLPQNSGLTVSTNNINWCSAQMYQSALNTAGIYDAKVMVTAPFAVSGTAALAGIYKAYEDINGVVLSDIAKDAGIQELITTGNLAELIGDVDASEVVNQLKPILDQTQNMTDSEVREQIGIIAQNMNISLTDAQYDQLLSLCRTLEKLDVKQLNEKLTDIQHTVNTVSEAQKTLTTVVEGVKNFFVSIGDFFTRLFS